MRAGSISKPGHGQPALRRMAIKNTGNTTIPVYGLCVARGAVATPLSTDEVWIEVDEPTGGWDAMFVNCQKELTSDDDVYGHAWPVVVGQPMWIAYDSGAPEVTDEWGPVDDSVFISENGSGFEIIEVDSANSLVRCVWKGHPILLGKTDEAIEGRTGAGTVNIYKGPFGAESDTGRDVVCGTFTDVDADIWVNLHWRDLAWYAVPLECNP